MRKWDFNEYIFFIVIAFMVVLGIGSIYRSCSVGIGEEIVVVGTVTDKGIKRIHGKDTYLIYTKTKNDVEVFQVTDSLFGGRFNSADVYAGIEVGKTYKFYVRGDRNEFLSWYPNIYEYVEEAEK